MAEISSFSALLERYHSLGSADRKAVLENFSADDRAAFEGAVSAAEKAAEEERLRQQRADRQYADYSPWLGDLVEMRTPAADQLTDATRQAVCDAHGELCEKSDAAAPTPGWRVFLKQLFAFEPQPTVSRP